MYNLALFLSLLIFLLSPSLTAGDELSPPPSATGDDPAGTATGEALEAVEEGGGETVTCFWTSVLPARDFQPEAGDAYRIAVVGSDRTNLSFVYRRLQPHRGDARIAVHTRKTPDNRVLVDQANPALFATETGEFNLSLFVPSGWPLYLVQEPANPYADPVVLSNIVELP